MFREMQSATLMTFLIFPLAYCFQCPTGYSSIQACIPPTSVISPNTNTHVPSPVSVESPFGKCLKVHNEYRALHHAPALAWDATLATAASEWVAKCLFQHEPNSPYGENLYAEFGTNVNTNANNATILTNAVKMWYDEIRKYDFKNPGFSMATGHATQVLWKDSTKLGCAFKYCPNMVIVSCKYSPPGNYQGMFPQNVLPK